MPIRGAADDAEGTQTGEGAVVRIGVSNRGVVLNRIDVVVDVHADRAMESRREVEHQPAARAMGASQRPAQSFEPAHDLANRRGLRVAALSAGRAPTWRRRVRDGHREQPQQRNARGFRHHLD